MASGPENPGRHSAGREEGLPLFVPFCPGLLGPAPPVSGPAGRGSGTAGSGAGRESPAGDGNYRSERNFAFARALRRAGRQPRRLQTL